jgi:hypothetical protein
MFIDLIFFLTFGSVYALDPVGSYRGFTTPVKFLGFDSKELPPELRRARVILMAGEGRIGFQPNIYTDNSDRLEQVL